MGSVRTLAALVVPLILALITLIRLIVKRVRKPLFKCNLASLATPSKVIKESEEAQEVCGCGRVDSKDPHMLIKPPLEVSQIINDVNVNQRHVHTDGITIVSLHPKCKILSKMALSIITISCLMSPLSAEILVFRMQIRGQRSGWKTVKLRAEAPAMAITKHFLWEIGRTRQITDIRVAPARDCTLSLNPMEDATFVPGITSFQDTPMELICKINSELNIRGTLFKTRQMSVARQPPLPCLRNGASELERIQISECLGRRFADTISTHSLDNE